MIINKKELSCRNFRQLSVYIHIPFCIKKCDYCDFLSAPATTEEIEEYTGILVREITEQSKFYQEYAVVTVFLGGGTPSLLSTQQLSQILKSLKQYYNLLDDAEITIEMNPGTVDKLKLKAYVEFGINRISIGLQSANDEELRTLGRIHNYRQFLKTYDTARKAGIKNINIDIMAALPGQTMASYIDTLEKVTSLEPEHISAYSLIVEEETPFFERYSGGKDLPSEDTDRKMYEATKHFLEEKGYFRYEISNYAKKGLACEHNLVYWTRKNYVGFGVGSASMIENVRWHNPFDQKEYKLGIAKEEIQRLSRKEQMEEFMFLGLRIISGISVPEFQELFKTSVYEIYGNVLKQLKKDGLLQEQAERIFLTQKGLDLSNYVFEKFLLS